MQDGTVILLKFLQEHVIGTFEEDKKIDKYHIEFSHDDFLYLKKLNLIYEGFHGGLIIGNLHINGGVNLIVFDSSRNKYRYVGEIEGWEYLSFPLKNQEFNDKFSVINKKTLNINSYQKTEFEIPKDCKIIDTKNAKVCFILLSEYKQFILNRFATMKHIKEIIELDRQNSG